MSRPTAGLEDAVEVALAAHRGQTDRAGRPYLLHPLRVMARLRGEAEQVAAVLHDVVEDSAWTLDDLRERGCSEDVVATVDALTRRPGEAYDAYLQRAAADPVARRVKLADLEDNLDLRRLDAVTDADRERLDRYRRAWLRLAHID